MKRVATSELLPSLAGVKRELKAARDALTVLDDMISRKEVELRDARGEKGLFYDLLDAARDRDANLDVKFLIPAPALPGCPHEEIMEFEDVFDDPESPLAQRVMEKYEFHRHEFSAFVSGDLAGYKGRETVLDTFSYRAAVPDGRLQWILDDRSYNLMERVFGLDCFTAQNDDDWDLSELQCSRDVSYAVIYLTLK